MKLLHIKHMGKVTILLMLIFALGVPSTTFGANTIKFAMLDPLSGPYEYYARMYYAGLKHTVDKINANGGLLGRQIEILRENHEFKPDMAARKAKKLILQDKVDFLGASGTHTSIAMHKVASKYKKIVFNYGAMGDAITGREFNRYVFRVQPSSHQVVTTMVYMAKQTTNRRFYLVNMDYSYGHSAAEAFKEQLLKMVPDAKVVGEDFHPIGTKDFAPYINKIKASKADAIYSANVGPDATNFVKQVREMGFKAPFPIYSMLPDVYQLNALKEDAIGCYFGFTFDLADKTPEAQAFLKKYQESHKNDKEYLTWYPVNAVSYVAFGMEMAFAAVERAGSLDPEKIIEAFEGFWYKSPVGWYSMRKCDHQIMLPLFAGPVVKGKNPWFDGSRDPKVNFPWILNAKKFSAMDIANPPIPSYNPRCP